MFKNNGKKLLILKEKMNILKDQKILSQNSLKILKELMLKNLDKLKKLFKKPLLNKKFNNNKLL